MSANPRLSSPASRWSHFTGLLHDEFDLESHWLRLEASIVVPAFTDVRRVVLHGAVKPWPAAERAGRPPRLEVTLNGTRVALVAPVAPGPFEVPLNLPAPREGENNTIGLRLHGTGWTDNVAWLGRVAKGLTFLGPIHRRLQWYRRQNKNRQLRIRALVADSGETIFDFTNRHSPFNHAFSRKHLRLGMNVVGFHQAELGVGESARCMVRAADAAGLPVAVVPLKLNCLNPQGDDSLAARLQTANPHGVNVIHVDAPQSRDIDHHHGRAFRAGKYNIAYWAWELPEFPDAWLEYAQYYDEIWCPSDFVREAIAAKLPHGVHTMPHAIGFARPTETAAAIRARFGLPADRFLFLFLYDLNSYSERKNPRALLEAYRRAFPASAEVGVVIKVHNRASNPESWARLQAEAAALPGATLIAETLPRADIYELQAACDCFVSLHRSEGFGLAIAESMYLGKPVISTDWSASAEFVNDRNGCPVQAKLITLDRNVGPYAKGQTWADPDIEHAAWWMRRLVAEPALREQLGAKARATIEERFAPAVIGRRYRRRLEAIAGW
ncbi:MAG TPA: glycosyltransferase family 4 protein [Opitutaceae bacterium]|nr:glycosyltransferase family 4 protein [Opitutaceae bacterium]